MQPATLCLINQLCSPQKGFQKVKTPDRLWQAIRNFWEKNKDRQEKEEWPDGNTYANHWSSPTYLVRIVEEKGLRGEGQVLAQSIWEATRNIMQEWCKQELEEVSMYGIRVYTEGSMLNPHVDQLPYVMSAVINIAQDVDEDWPFEVIGHDGQAYNVTMKPGEMILYESHSILHGRPFSLQGRYYANVFVHFEPTGHSMKYHGYDGSDKKNGGQQTRMTRNKQIGGHEIEVCC
jgi:prolyl 4-hydroxylase